MSKEIKDIPPQELKRIEDMAHADTPMYGTMSELLAHEFGYIKGAKAEYLRHLSGKLGAAPRWPEDLIFAAKWPSARVFEFLQKYGLKWEPGPAEHNSFYLLKGDEKIEVLPGNWIALDENEQFYRFQSIPSSKPEIGPRWVNASERLSDVIHDVTMRLVGQVRTWFGTLEIQIGKVVGPHGNIFDPRTVEYLDESIPSSEPK